MCPRHASKFDGQLGIHAFGYGWHAEWEGVVFWLGRHHRRREELQRRRGAASPQRVPVGRRRVEGILAIPHEFLSTLCQLDEKVNEVAARAGGMGSAAAGAVEGSGVLATRSRVSCVSD
jgi:hypothetical protein